MSAGVEGGRGGVARTPSRQSEPQSSFRLRFVRAVHSSHFVHLLCMCLEASGVQAVHLESYEDATIHGAQLVLNGKGPLTTGG